MFTEAERKSLTDLLNQVLPLHADALVTARVKLAAGDDDLTKPEKDGLDYCLSMVDYAGKQDTILAQMHLVSNLQNKLAGVAQADEKKPARVARHKKKVQPEAVTESIP